MCCLNTDKGSGSSSQEDDALAQIFCETYPLGMEPGNSSLLRVLWVEMYGSLL